MRVLIYEDDPKDIETILVCLKSLFNSLNIDYTVKTTAKKEEFYRYVKNADLVFMDIEGIDSNGIDIAIKVREENIDIKIIFVTNHASYSIEGYKANANGYFLKPLLQETFDFEMKRIVNDYIQNNYSFILSSPIRKVYAKEVLYVEYSQRKSYLVLKSNERLEDIHQLQEWKKELEPYYFVQIYKSILVNINMVKTIGKTDIILINEEALPLSRLYRKEFEKAYSNKIRRLI